MNQVAYNEEVTRETVNAHLTLNFIILLASPCSRVQTRSNINLSSFIFPQACNNRRVLILSSTILSLR